MTDLTLDVYTCALQELLNGGAFSPTTRRSPPDRPKSCWGTPSTWNAT
ncbi:hypothetical protein ABT147_45480 [Streptomyces sp. NPDC001868]